ncbi:MAG: MinD/ParA family protein [Clostridiales bacterium]|jgi:flagellar biosynthesis protein FlhG|nr:MinD/ParA family protein [Clostridiales bacterium]
MDQANRLRDIVKQRELAARKEGNSAGRPATSRVITVTSGKGGVGKSNFTLNLAIQMRKLDQRVILVDADLGLSNIEVLAGIIPRYSFADVLSGRMRIEEALTEGPLGLKFLSGGAGLTNLAQLGEKQINTVVTAFGALDELSDIILIDTGAGISRSVLNFILASTETILVATPEPTSVADAYAMIKSLRREANASHAIKIVTNMAATITEGQDIYEKLSKVSEQFLGVKLEQLGTLPQDSIVPRAVKRQEPFMLSYPNSECAKAIEKIAYKLLNIEPAKAASLSGIASFIKRLAKGF